MGFGAFLKAVRGKRVRKISLPIQGLHREMLNERCQGFFRKKILIQATTTFEVQAKVRVAQEPKTGTGSDCLSDLSLTLSDCLSDSLDAL